MKKNYSNMHAKKLAAYSTLAGCFLATTNEADAQIVYVDIPDVILEIPVDTTFELYEFDADSDGNTDFLFQVAAVSSNNWTFARLFGSITSTTAYAFGNTGNRVIGYSGAYFPYANALESDDPINVSADFLDYRIAFLGSLYSGLTYGPFANETDKYIGFQIPIDDELHYGWIRVDLQIDPVVLTIKDYGYNSVAGEEIMSGLKEGTTTLHDLTLDHISVYASESTIHIQLAEILENAAVLIYNMAGQVIYQDKLNETSKQIQLTDAAGIYTVQITSNGAVYNKSVSVF